jgi:hypothetical protein
VTAPAIYSCLTSMPSINTKTLKGNYIIAMQIFISTTNALGPSINMKT